MPPLLSTQRIKYLFRVVSSQCEIMWMAEVKRKKKPYLHFSFRVCVSLQRKFSGMSRCFFYMLSPSNFRLVELDSSCIAGSTLTLARKILTTKKRKKKREKKRCEILVKVHFRIVYIYLCYISWDRRETTKQICNHHKQHVNNVFRFVWIYGWLSKHSMKAINSLSYPFFFVPPLWIGVALSLSTRRNRCFIRLNKLAYDDAHRPKLTKKL